MGLQLESLSQSPFEQYGPWHFHDIRFKRDEPVHLSKALLQVSSIPGLNDRLSELSRSGKEQLQGAIWVTGEGSQIRSPAKLMSASSSRPDSSTQASPWTLWTAGKPHVTKPGGCADTRLTEKVISTHPVKEPVPAPRPSLKRRRPDTDVDGPNTSTMSSKKRRLLRHLITSRLSEPFSLPATHILNRESVASGDRRFLKLATILAARRMNHPGGQHHLSQPSPSSMLRRAAVINRVRLRLQNDAVGLRGDGARDEVARTSVLRQTTLSAPGSVHQVPVTPSASQHHLVPPPSPMARNIYQGGQTHVLSRSGVVVRSSPPGSPAGLRATEGTPGLLRLPSPRLRPLRSPELRTSRPAIELVDLDDLDDDSTAFPSSEHESRYEDDPDDVYADFSLIFGGGSEGDSSDEEGSAEHFEDVMDDLDGIPWNARC